MASKSVSTSKYNGRYLQLTVSQESQSQSANTSSCKWVLSSVGGNDNYYTIYGCKATVHGSVVWDAGGTITWTSKKFPAAKGSVDGTFTVAHDNTTGEGSVGFTLRGSVFKNAPTDYSDTLALDKIPRNPKISSWSVSATSETSVSVSWSADMTIDYLQYSTNNGSNWTNYDTSNGTSGSFTISGLSAGSSYNIKINLRASASQLWSGASGAKSVTTYSYPTATLPSSNVTLNSSTKSISFSFNNPLKRTISYSASIGGYSVSGSTTGTSASLNLNSDSIYNEISGTSGTLNVAASATGLNRTGTLTLLTDATYAAPTINTNYFAWQAQHTNSAIQVGTGYMVQNLSYLQVRYTSASIIGLRKGASSLKSVTVSFGGTTKTLSTSFANHNGTTTYNYSSATAATITVTDNRGYSASNTVNIPFLPYSNPTAQITNSRAGGYGTTVTLNAKGFCSSLNNTNSITKIEYKKGSNGTAATMSNGTATVELDSNQSATYYVNVTDELGNTSGWKEYTVIPIGQPIFFIDEALGGVGVNGFPTGRGIYPKGEVLNADNPISTTNPGRLYNGGVQIHEVYASAANGPAPYGNLINIGGKGQSQIFIQWNASQTTSSHVSGHIWYRSWRDSGAERWSEWVQMIDTSNALDLIYPLGSVYMSMQNKSPASFLGGSWAQIKTCFLWATGSTPGQTGGAQNQTIDISHTHSINHSHWVSNHSHTVNSHRHGLYANGIALIHHNSGRFWFHEIGVSEWWDTGSAAATGYTTNTANTSAIRLGGETDDRSPGTTSNGSQTLSHSGNSGGMSANSSKTISTMPPYYEVYMWRRTG